MSGWLVAVYLLGYGVAVRAIGGWMHRESSFHDVANTLTVGVASLLAGIFWPVLALGWVVGRLTDTRRQTDADGNDLPGSALNASNRRLR